VKHTLARHIALLVAAAVVGVFFVWLGRVNERSAPSLIPANHTDDGEVRKKKSFTPPHRAPAVIGSWLLKYASQDHAFLDVALADGSGAGIRSVVADVTAPTTTYRDLALIDNSNDGTDWESEWRVVLDSLPKPPPAGLYWVSRIRVESKDGSHAEYFASDPYGTYRYRYVEVGMREAIEQPSQAWIGSLYFPETNAAMPLVFINTFYPGEGRAIDPVLELYAAGDTRRWLAVNDEPDVDLFYPRLAYSMRPGETYYLRVAGDRERVGHYGIVLSRGNFATASAQPAAMPDTYEPDDDAVNATPLQLDEPQFHTLELKEDEGDVDWFVFAVPSPKN